MPSTTTTKADITTESLVTSPRRSRWLIVTELIALIVIAILALEWFFGVCGIGQQEFLEPDQELGCHHIPGKLVTWRLEGFSNDHLSSAGWRDVEHTLAKPPGVVRIALLGDSSTEGLQVPLNSTYGRVLEKQLNEMHSGNSFEVINFACSSYSTGQELLQFENHVLAYHPDIVVVLYNRGDSLENVRNPLKSNVEPRPYFYLDQSGKLQQDSTLLSNSALRPNPLFGFLRRNSHIYGVLTQTDLSLSIHERFYRKLRSWFTSLLQLAQSVNAGWKPALPGNTTYPVPDAMKVTDALMSRFASDCKSRHIQFILMMFPNTISDPELSMQAFDLKKLSQKAGFGYIDLTDPFLATKDPRSRFLQFHFSAEGHQVVANELCKFLLSTAK